MCDEGRGWTGSTKAETQGNGSHLAWPGTAKGKAPRGRENER